MRSVGSEVKDITDEIPFEIPSSWEFARLSTVCWLGDAVKCTGERLPYLDAKTLRGKADKTYLIEGKIVDVATKVILVDGENSSEVFDIPFRGYKGSTFKMLETVSHFNFDYLNEVFDYYRDIFRGNKIGAAIPHLNKKLFRSLLISIPPLNEQARIVSEIEKYEPLIAEYNKLEQQATRLDNEIYDKLKKSILQYAIQGKLVSQDPNDEPASVLLERIRAEKKAKLGKKYVDRYIYKGDDNCYYEKVGTNEPVCLDELPFDIPDSWCWARLGSIGEWGAGATPSRTNSQYYGGNIPWLKTGELNNDIVYDSEEHVTDEAFQNCSLRYCSIGDVLIAMYGATIGKLAIAGVPLTTNQACCACTLYEGIYNFYLFYFLMEEKDNFTHMGFGGAQPNISKEKIIKHLFPVPPYEEQKRIVSTFIDIQNKLKDED